MFISLNLKGIESAHDSEPTYNRLFDRWDSLDKVQVPKGTLNLIGINLKDVACYEVNLYAHNISVIENTNKINL